jgi:predicted phage tail protein
MDELKAELKTQTELLKALNENISGLRAEMKEAREKGMADSMSQVMSSLKGTPLEGVMASMVAKMKAGGANG